MSLNCPRCGKDDRVQKVSVIYAAGTTKHSSHSDTKVIVQGSQRILPIQETTVTQGASLSGLAAQLVPPKKPQFSTQWYYAPIKSLFSITVPLIILPFVSPIDKLYKRLYGLCLCVGVVLALTSASYHDEITGKVLLVLAILTVPLMAALYYVGLTKTQKQFENKLLPAWQKDMEQWEQSFYCHRDGTLFVPEASGVVTSEQKTLVAS